MELTADGSRLFLLYPERLVVRDVDSGAERTIVGDLAGDETHFVSSLDGRRVSLFRGEHLKVWDTSTGSLVRVWRSDGCICDAAPRMMPDGRLILDPRADGVYLFDITTSELRMHLPVPWRPWKIEVSPDGRSIEATSGRYGDAWLESDDAQVVWWDATTGRPVDDTDREVLRGYWDSCHGWASARALTPDHRSIVMGFPDGLVGIRDRGEKKVRWLVGHSARITAVVVSPDGQTIVSASADRTVHVSRLDAGAGIAATFRAKASIVKCVIRRDGNTLVVLEETGQVHVLRELLSAPALPLPHQPGLNPIEWALAPDGSRLFLLYPGWLAMHDVDSATERRIVDGLWGDEEALVASVDGRRVSLRCGSELRVWEVDRGSLVRTWQPVLDRRARMTPDGHGILDRPRGARCGLALFDVDTGRLRVNLSRARLAGSSIQVSADGRWVAAAISPGRGETQFAVWDTTTGRAVDFAVRTPDCGEFRGHWFAVVVKGASVWDLSSGALVFYREDYKRAFTALAVMPDDRGLVVGFGDGRLGLWDLSGESKVRRLPGHEAGIKAIAAAPDGRAIVSASSDGVVQVCAVENGTVTATYRAPGRVRDCLIRPDGKTLVVVEENRRVHVLRDLLSVSVAKETPVKRQAGANLPHALPERSGSGHASMHDSRRAKRSRKSAEHDG